MKKRLQHVPFFLLLLPAFFVLHGYVGHYGYMEPWYCWKLLGDYICWTAILYGIFYAIFREPTGPAFFVAYVMFFNFSFGYVQDLLTAHSPALSRYRIILPLYLLLGILLAVRLRKAPKKSAGPVLFLNVLLLVWLLVDGVLLAGAMLRPGVRGLFVKEPPLQAGSVPAGRERPDRRDPDIYFLIFDEYGSTQSLKKCCGYDNGGLDSWLREKGFHIQDDSRSNYNFTPVCMASMLNMSYLGWTGPIGQCSEHDYASCERLIRHNAVTGFLAARGYSIVNYSIFDLDHHPSIVQQRVLPLKDKLINEATFTYRLSDELGWHHYEQWPFLQRYLSHIPYETLENDAVLLEKVQMESRQTHTAPVFVYTHLEMPHAPFVFAADGRLKTPKELSPLEGTESLSDYTGYLPYTNAKLKKLVTDIQQNTKNTAVIILMGDHGLRCEIPGEDHSHYFQNLNAVYFPERDYHLLYDSISGVNQFRVVFNQLFGQQMPLLKDSTLFITDRK